MQPYLITIGLLSLSNLFMTFAWYAHLKAMPGRHWVIAALLSWGIALFEWLCHQRIVIFYKLFICNVIHA